MAAFINDPLNDSYFSYRVHQSYRILHLGGSRLVEELLLLFPNVLLLFPNVLLRTFLSLA
jgi:hypothetical protein